MTRQHTLAFQKAFRLPTEPHLGRLAWRFNTTRVGTLFSPAFGDADPLPRTGNLLAVFSWMFLCAPIATRSRLTLYYQLEKICGRRLVVLYNLANGVLFCFLAGAMITVSATAVGIPFGMPVWPGVAELGAVFLRTDVELMRKSRRVQVEIVSSGSTIG